MKEISADDDPQKHPHTGRVRLAPNLHPLCRSNGPHIKAINAGKIKQDHRLCHGRWLYSLRLALPPAVSEAPEQRFPEAWRSNAF
jgi:hypothetical protein